MASLFSDVVFVVAAISFPESFCARLKKRKRAVRFPTAGQGNDDSGNEIVVALPSLLLKLPWQRRQRGHHKSAYLVWKTTICARTACLLLAARAACVFCRFRESFAVLCGTWTLNDPDLKLCAGRQYMMLKFFLLYSKFLIRSWLVKIFILLMLISDTKQLKTVFLTGANDGNFYCGVISSLLLPSSGAD